MTSKEVLEKMLDLITEYSYWVEAHNYCETIKQYLECLKEKGKELIKVCHKAIDIAQKYKKVIEVLKDLLNLSLCIDEYEIGGNRV